MSPLRRVLTLILATFSCLVLCAVWTLIFYYFLWNLPENFYSLWSSNTEEACGQIQSGMALPDVMSIIHRAPAPNYLAHWGNKIEFSWGDGLCVVELDADTNRVSNVYIDHSRVAQDPTFESSGARENPRRGSVETSR